MDKYEIQTKIFQEKLFIPGTNVLKNKKGITDKKTLKEFEGKHFSNKSLSVPMGDLSTKHLQKIHKHLFEDTYEWAGEFRNFPTARESSVFCRPEYIKQETDKITSNINISNLKKMKKKEFVKKLAHIITELNAVHPFLDGNGRILRIYAQQLSKAAEYKLNILKIRKEAWNQAAINSFNGDNKNLERIFSNNLYRSKDLGIGR